MSKKGSGIKKLTDKQKHRFYLRHAVQQVNKSHIGDAVFIECGVKYGTSAVIIAEELPCQGYLFDTWKRFEGLSSEDASPHRIRRVKKRNTSHAKKHCKKALAKHGLSDRCHMVQGDVRKTIRDFFDKRPDQKVIFAHLDLDVYLPTKEALQAIWPHLSVHGFVFFHDYGSSKWKGIKKCVDDFASNNESSLHVYSDIHACILRKTKKGV